VACRILGRCFRRSSCDTTCSTVAESSAVAAPSLNAEHSRSVAVPSCARSSCIVVVIPRNLDQGYDSSAVASIRNHSTRKGETETLPVESVSRRVGECGQCGQHGPRDYHWAPRADPQRLGARRRHWLLARRSISDPSRIAYYLCYGRAGEDADNAKPYQAEQRTYDSSGAEDTPIFPVLDKAKRRPEHSTGRICQERRNGPATRRRVMTIGARRSGEVEIGYQLS
jgi:hypothetical protein